MNHRLIVNQVSRLLFLLAAAMLVMALCSALWHWSGREDEWVALQAFLLAAVVPGSAAALLHHLTRGAAPQLTRRDAVLLVVVTWLVGALVAALPFFIWGVRMGEAIPEPAFGRFTPALFESMSGLTTCGASVLGTVEDYPRSILLWRSSTHWIGGLGIVVLFVAVLPSIGTAGKRMFMAESTGVTPEGLRPQIRQTARILWLIYASLTVAQIVLLLLAGMDLFDSVCHSFGTVATGGFSTRTASIAAFDSPTIELIVVLFMFLGGVNFALYFRLLRGKPGNVLHDAELRWYAGLLGCAVLIVTLSIWSAGQPISIVNGTQVEPTILQSLRSALFVTTSMQTTTGFCTADYEYWPALAMTSIVLLMIVGGCGGSTAGGIKVIRSMIAVRALKVEVEREYRPTAVRPILVGTAAIDPQSRTAAVVMVMAALLLIPLAAALMLAIDPDPRMDLATAASSALAAFSVVGPAFGAVGPSENYGWMSDRSLAVLTTLMLVGRLEIFAAMALLSRKFWGGA